MTTSKSLPVRPSLDSLRKQAKKLARAVAAGDTHAIARIRTQLPKAEPPLSLRDAQLALAREYGFAGWRELVAEVNKRLGNDLEWVVRQARQVIHDNDVERLKQLLAEYPALLAWAGDDGHFGVADFLLEHGADINTNWISHEPASILHHLVFLQRSRESMQFLIDRGIDMTIKDYRWNSTAQGWALYALKDEKLAQWLDDAERMRAK